MNNMETLITGTEQHQDVVGLASLAARTINYHLSSVHHAICQFSTTRQNTLNPHGEKIYTPHLNALYPFVTLSICYTRNGALI